MKSSSTSSIWVQYRKKYPADDVLQNTFEDIIEDVRRRLVSSNPESRHEATDGAQTSPPNVPPLGRATDLPERPIPCEVVDQSQPGHRTDVFAEFVEAWKTVGYGNGQHDRPPKRLNVLGWTLGR